MKLQETWHQALDCSGSKQQKLRGERERGEMKTFVADLLGLKEAD